MRDPQSKWAVAKQAVATASVLSAFEQAGSLNAFRRLEQEAGKDVDRKHAYLYTKEGLDTRWYVGVAPILSLPMMASSPLLPRFCSPHCSLIAVP